MENNKLIAEFMGNIPIFENEYKMVTHNNMCYGIDELKYDTDWNWLMPVVERIESLGVKSIRYIDFHIMPDAIIVTNQDNEENPLILINRSEGIGSVQKDIIMFETKLQATYKAVVEFINWHNEHI